MAERAINFLSLQKAELEYEVSLRGHKPADSVAELRKQIAVLSKEYPSDAMLCSHLPPSEDIEGVQTSLEKSLLNLKTLKSKYNRNLFLRTEGLLNQIYYRLDRIQFDEDDDETLESILSECRENFESQMSDLKSLAPESDVSAVKINANDLEKCINITIDQNKSMVPNFATIKYDGKTCVRSFLQKLDEFVKSRGIGYEKVLSFGHEIFTGEALPWFRSIRRQVKDWSQVAEALIADFSPKNFDAQFLSQIRSRLQGKDEKICIYLAVMDCMFSRLTKPLSEDEKLEILSGNILPCYANVLASAGEIFNIDNLKEVCQKYERVQTQFFKRSEPSSRNCIPLATEFVYRGESSAPSNFEKSKPLNNFQNTKSYVSAVASKDVYCPRCRNNTHSLKTCTQPRDIVCFKCGKKGVRTPDCTKCNPKN